MTISDLPPFFNFPYTDKEGKMTSDAYLYNDQMFQTLNTLVILANEITSTIVGQGNVTINGINPPSKTTAEIATLFADVAIPIGTIWYDNTLGKLKFKGTTLQTITSTP